MDNVGWNCKLEPEDPDQMGHKNMNVLCLYEYIRMLCMCVWPSYLYRDPPFHLNTKDCWNHIDLDPDWPYLSSPMN